MLDVEIREAVERRLRATHRTQTDTRYRHELGLCMGETRVDVAAINGEIIGCEIKGSQDTLLRLPKQISIYSRVVDRSILVTEERHLNHAMEMLPEHWGIWLVRPGQRGAVIRPLRNAQQSPDLDPFSIAQLLWRDEGMDLLRSIDAARGLSRATRFQVWDALVEHIPDLNQLRKMVRVVLKGRKEWPGG